jgi:FdhD protein
VTKTPPRPSVVAPRVAWRGGVATRSERVLAEETPVAVTYDGAVHAVMMATPADLTDFAVGFSLTEGVITHPDDIGDIEVAATDDGVNLRIWLTEGPSDAFAARRRRYVGPAGCGMCGLESLAEANRALPRVDATLVIDPAEIEAALAAMPELQALNHATHAVHAAGFWQRGKIRLLREDVGRHNALDKLAGAMAQARLNPRDGLIVMSSRLSVELVQKTAMIGAPVLVTISAPTAQAVRIGESAGITLVGVGRADGFEIFTHGQRIAVPALEDAGHEA